MIAVGWAMICTTRPVSSGDADAHMVKRKLEAAVPKLAKKIAQFVSKGSTCSLTTFAWRKFADVHMVWPREAAIVLRLMDLGVSRATQVSFLKVTVAFPINAVAPTAPDSTRQVVPMMVQCPAHPVMLDLSCLVECAQKRNAAVPMASHKWEQTVFTLDTRIVPSVLKAIT